MKTLWGGRFKSGLADIARAYSYSLEIDQMLFPYDIKTNNAHVKTLRKAGLLSVKESARLLKGLAAVEKDFAGKELSRFASKHEDVHTFIQNELEKKVGSVAKKLHTARSRNDQVATSTRLYVKDAVESIIEKIGVYQKALLQFAKKGKEVTIPGYTHLQRAQIVLLAHHVLAYVEMAERDKERFASALPRISRLPLGSGALAGLSFSLDRAYTAKLLKFSSICTNSIDAVSSRDYILETLAHCAIFFTHLSRLCEDLILWNSQEFAFIVLPDEFATGSSIMPHKKNADMLELIRGRSGKVLGNLVSLLVTMKGLPLAYNRDMQEDKEALLMSVELTKCTLDLLAQMIPQLSVKKNNCLIASYDGLLFATDIMDYLVKKGLPLKDAHTLVGTIVQYSLESKKALSQLTQADFKSFSRLFENDIKNIFDPQYSVRQRKTTGSTHPLMVQREMKKWQKRISR